MTSEATTDALNAALEAAQGTPTGGGPGPVVETPQQDAGPAFASPLFFADQSLGEEAGHKDSSAQTTPQETAAPMDVSPQPQPPASAPAPPPPKAVAPMTVEQVEIVHYKKKLVKLERKRRQWVQAFDQKLEAYRRKRDELEQQLERRRADQEAQKIKVVEETERLREIYALALQEMTALQASVGVADVAEKELEKKGNWDTIYTPAIEEMKKAKRKAWEETKKGVGEVKRSNLEQMRKKVEAYRQLGMALPQSEIDQEREQYNAEITEMQGKLEAQKVQLDAEMADLEQKMVLAKTSFNDFKNQHKKLEREEARLQQLLQEPIP